jgi:hypothetical protein
VQPPMPPPGTGSRSGHSWTRERALPRGPLAALHARHVHDSKAKKNAVRPWVVDLMTPPRAEHRSSRSQAAVFSVCRPSESS